MEGMKVGKEDRCSVFRLLPKIYGREEEMRSIFDVMNEVRNKEKRMLIVIEGFAGNG
jgi:hypothetical protein